MKDLNIAEKTALVIGVCMLLAIGLMIWSLTS